MSVKKPISDPKRARELRMPIDARRFVLETTTILTETPTEAEAAEALRLARASAAQERKLELLLEEFGINREDPDCWKKLSLALGCRLFPGLRIRTSKGPGRPKGTSKIDARLLFSEVEKLTASGRTITEACAMLARHHRNFKAVDADSLRATYGAERKRRERALQVGLMMVARAARGGPSVS